MNENELIDLLRRFEQGECTPDEQAQIEDWYNKASASSSAPFPELIEREKRIWGQVKPKRHFPFVKYAAAVIVLMGVSYAGYFVMQPSAAVVKDVQPGGNSAVLTLGDGKQIKLDSSSNGQIAAIAGVSVTNNSGSVVYKVVDNKSDVAQVNKISTPNGGQYKLILPDGSQVYLNAASSLTFPSRFAANNRTVQLTGEAYFEVNRNPQQPFIVATADQQIKVLGTHFNVFAYPNEIITTTLAEGSVELSQSSSLKKQLLKPNQQAALLPNGFQVKNVNATDESAWKDGVFLFKELPLRSAIQQICRWYNLDADVANLPEKNISAELSRTLTLSELLKGIEFISGVKIQLSDKRKLTVIY